MEELVKAQVRRSYAALTPHALVPATDDALQDAARVDLFPVPAADALTYPASGRGAAGRGEAGAPQPGRTGLPPRHLCGRAGSRGQAAQTPEFAAVEPKSK